MKKHPFRQSSTFSVRLSDDQLCLLLGAIASTLEERGLGFSKSDLRLLVQLHERFCILCGFESFDYAYRDGAVVNARNPADVIVPAVIPPDSVQPAMVANG